MLGMWFMTPTMIDRVKKFGDFIELDPTKGTNNVSLHALLTLNAWTIMFT